MIPLHRVASLFYNRPLLITPQRAQMISAFLVGRIEGRSGAAAFGEQPIEEVQAFASTQNRDGSVSFHSPRASRFVGEYSKDEVSGKPRPYRMTGDGIAIITMIGELVNRGAWMDSMSGMISYEGFTAQLQMAENDSKVKAVVMDMESPGGEAIGAMEASAQVRKTASVKPVIAFGNGMAASAMYALASGATARVGIPSSEWGSIGVVLMHLDMSGALQQAGLRPTFIFAGARKVDGNPYEALPKDVQSRLQTMVNKFYGSFVSTVAQGTGLSEDAIRATEAELFTADDAKSLGLIDEIGTLDDVLGMIRSARAA